MQSHFLSERPAAHSRALLVGAEDGHEADLGELGGGRERQLEFRGGGELAAAVRRLGGRRLERVRLRVEDPYIGYQHNTGGWVDRACTYTRRG